MVEIGFLAADAREALRVTDNNMQLAVERLLTGRQPSVSGRPLVSSHLLTKIPGLSTKNAEKASKMINSASEMGMSFFNRAKVLVSDSTKKISTALNEQQVKLGNRRRSRTGSAESVGSTDGQYRIALNQSDEDISSPIASVGVSFQQPFRQPVNPTPPPKATKKQRVVPYSALSPDQQSQCDSFKGQGNTFFKTGQYGDAESMYSRAIACLPQGHIAVVPLLNNRAAAHLKNGSNKEVVADCTIVIDLCRQEIEYDDVTADQVQEFKDALAKAFLRRATGYENMEKWEDSLKDYKSAMEWNSGTKGASDGIRRCNKAISQKNEIHANARPQQHAASANGLESGLDEFVGSKSEAPLSKSAQGALSFMASDTTATLPVPIGASERVDELRARDQMMEREEDERLRLKDSVDAKVQHIKYVDSCSILVKFDDMF
jgi:tetratricopeptide (TPR) repeat protein